MTWMFIFPQTSHVETLTSKVTALGKWRGQKGSTLVNGVTFLIKKLLRASFIPAHEIPREGTLSAEEKDSSPSLDSIRVLISDFWVSRTVSKKLPCSKFHYDTSQGDLRLPCWQRKANTQSPTHSHPAPQGAYWIRLLFFKKNPWSIDPSNIS